MARKTDHQPAVIWCANCGAALSAPVEVFATSQHGDHQLKVQFCTKYIHHTCGDAGETP